MEGRFGTLGGAPPTRPEMKGPWDVSSLLAGLKSKSIDVPPKGKNGDTNSTVSVEEVRQMQNSSQMPVRTKRRQKSDRNTVSLQL